MVLFAIAACSSDNEPEVSASEVVEHYADGVHHSYVLSLNSARVMRQAIHTFIDGPTAATLEAAKRAWLIARDDYGPTEAYRFYNGPIGNEEAGPEGRINAWPMNEAYVDYVDYVERDLNAGIINFVDKYPEITTDLLIGDLQFMGDAWAPGGSSNYRAYFLELDTNAALVKIITGIGELSRGELAGERLVVAYEARSQEDEHSCFSDNTVKDIIGNARGIENVWLGDYGALQGPGIVDLVRQEDPGLAAQLTAEIANSVAYAMALPSPFDAHLVADLPNSDPGRQAVLKTIESLEDQTDSLVAAAEAIGVTISVS